MPPHRLNNFEMQNHYQNEARFNGVCSRDNLPKTKIKDGACVIVLILMSTLILKLIALFSLNNNDTYFDIFVVEYIPKKIEKFVDKSIIVTSIFKIQACDSIMYGHLCIGCIYFMLARKTF